VDNLWISHVMLITKNSFPTRPKNRLICQSPMLHLQYKESEKLSLRKVRSKMTNTNVTKKVAYCEKHEQEFSGICGSCIGEFGYFD